MRIISRLARFPTAVRNLRRELKEITSIPDLGRYWIGQLVSQLGSDATSFVLITSVYLETGSLVWFALFFAIDNIPGLFLSPVAGTLVDKYDRRMLHIVGDGGVALVTLATLFLWSTDQLDVTAIFVLILLGSSFEVIQDAAGEAMYQQLVPKDKLVRAGALLDPFDEVLEVVAPALGVTLLAISNAGVVFVLDLLTFVFALWTLFTFRYPERFRNHLTDVDDDEDEHALGSIQFFMQGARYLKGNDVLRFLFNYNVVNDFLSSVILLLAASAALELGGEVVLAAVQSSAGGGAILGMLLIAVFGLFRGEIIRLNVIVPGLIIGTCLLFVPFISTPTALAIAAFVFMLLSAPLDAAIDATFLAGVPKKLIGRVSAVFDVAAGIANLVVLLGIAQLVERVLVPYMAQNPLNLGALGSFGGIDATVDGQLFVIGLAGVGMIVLNLLAIPSKRRLATEKMAKQIETQSLAVKDLASNSE